MPPSRASRFPLIFAAATLFVASGCVAETTVGGTTTFAYAWWVAPAIFAGMGLVLLVAPHLKRRKASPMVSAVVAGLLGCLFASEAWLNRTTLAPDGVQVQYGVFGLLNRVDVKFSDLQGVKVDHEWVHGGKTSHLDKFLVFQFKGGPDVEKLDVSTPIGERSAGPILKAAAAAGVPVVDAEGRPLPKYAPKPAETAATTAAGTAGTPTDPKEGPTPPAVLGKAP